METPGSALVCPDRQPSRREAPRQVPNHLAGLEVNSVGRKAFRRLRNKAMVEAFKYHHVVGKPSETAPSPTTPATTQPVS